MNENGEAIGVISLRALTSASQSSMSDLKVPAGSTIALSLYPMNAIRKMMRKNA